MLSVPSTLAQVRSSSHSSGPLKRTPFYEVHKEHGGKIIDFCGWEMPVLYEKTGVLAEVKGCRESTAIFDVSHMAQVRVHGERRKEFVERVTVVDVDATPLNGVHYTVVPNEKGGCIDDAMVTHMEDHLHIIVNSACYEKDMKHFNKHLKEFPGVTLEPLYESHALFALQGPASEAVFAQFLSAEDAERLKQMPFMTRMTCTVGGIDGCWFSRSGYTGEDGFEISIPIKHAADLMRAVAAVPGVFMAGLGSRDNLRLEAALSLYGQDLEQDISIVEGGQQWAMSKRRKQQGGFIGEKEILRQLKEGPPRKRIGLVVKGVPAREGATVHDKKGKQLGLVTSGGFSPMTGKNIAMGLVTAAAAKMDSEVQVKVRGKMYPAVISPMPFFPHRFKK